MSRSVCEIENFVLLGRCDLFDLVLKQKLEGLLAYLAALTLIPSRGASLQLAFKAVSLRLVHHLLRFLALRAYSESWCMRFCGCEGVHFFHLS